MLRFVGFILIVLGLSCGGTGLLATAVAIPFYVMNGVPLGDIVYEIWLSLLVDVVLLGVVPFGLGTVLARPRSPQEPQSPD